MPQKKEELQETLADMGQPTEGTKKELEERLLEVQGPSVVEADSQAKKANEKFAENQKKLGNTSPSYPSTIEARKSK